MGIFYIMETALRILAQARHKLEVEKRVWIKQGDLNLADKINEEILDINIAISELVSIRKKKQSKQDNIRRPWFKCAYSVINK